MTPDPQNAATLEPNLADACANWLITLMSERQGSGVDVFRADGTKQDNSWVLDDVITVLHGACPDVVGRMLQAGATAYIREVETCTKCGGSGKGEFIRRGKISGFTQCPDCQGKGQQYVE